MTSDRAIESDSQSPSEPMRMCFYNLEPVGVSSQVVPAGILFRFLTHI